jgi:two-component system sensor histidine kinase BaeS
VTGEQRWGPLGWRLLAAFVVAALSSVVVMAIGAVLAADRGLAAAEQSTRRQTAEQVAGAVASAYTAADGWSGAEMDTAVTLTEGAGARLVVRDAAGGMVRSPRGGPGPVSAGPGGPGGPGHAGPGGPGGGDGSYTVSAPVVVSGTQVGSVYLVFPTAVSSAGRAVAWGWLGGAACVALAVALAASWFVNRRIARPLGRLARAARAMARGDRTIRSAVSGPGELGELGRAFDSMVAEVAVAEQARRALTSDVAHELRTPLSTLRAGLEELRDGLAEPDPARLTVLHDQTLRLGRVVDDLAQLAAAESAALSLHLAEVDLAQLARGALASHAPRLDAAGLAVHTELTDGVFVRGDADRLHQALGNLLDNAERYARPGDAVTVRVSAVGATAVLEVADTGPGLPADTLPRVFDRLWRGPDRRDVAGSGIGLAVVRELVTAHGGVVEAASGPAGGATFTIRLPVGDSAAHLEAG